MLKIETKRVHWRIKKLPEFGTKVRNIMITETHVKNTSSQIKHQIIYCKDYNLSDTKMSYKVKYLLSVKITKQSTR